MKEYFCYIHQSNDYVFACYVSACYICCDDANHKGKLLFSLCLYIASVGIVNKHFKLAFLTMYFFFQIPVLISHILLIIVVNKV